MDEMNLTLPPELESSLDDFYAIPEPDPAFASRLDQDLQSRFGEFSSPETVSRKTFMQSLRARPALALLIVLLAIALLSGVAYAISRLTGFIPGFGFTSGAGDVYVLGEPASASVDGVTLRVENAVDDGSRFWVELTRSGELDSHQDFQIAAYILLPDGQKVQSLTGRETGISAGQTQMAYEFPPLPAGAKTIILQFEFITRDGDTLRSIDIPLVLRPIRPGELMQTLTKLARKYPGKKMQQLVEALQPALASLPPVAQEAAARQVIIDRIQKDLALFTQLTIPPSTQADVVNHTYAKMCKLGNAALVSEACTELHAWRKLVKTLGYQLAMVDMKTPDKARLLSRMTRLGSKLGDIHDLCFLQEMIEGSALLLCQELDMGPLFKRLARERAALLKTIRKRYCHVCPPPRQQDS